MSLPFISNRSIKQIVIEVFEINFKIENSLLFNGVNFSFPFPMFEFQRIFCIGNRRKKTRVTILDFSDSNVLSFKEAFYPSYVTLTISLLHNVTETGTWK